TITPIQTFLKEPDLVFLTVAESKMKPYFKRTKLYSYVIQLYLIFLVAAAFGPMYSNGYPERSLTSCLVILFTMLIFKYINMTMSWWTLTIRLPSSPRIEQ